jgi:hypothetical protein
MDVPEFSIIDSRFFFNKIFQIIIKNILKKNFNIILIHFISKIFKISNTNLKFLAKKTIFRRRY